MEKLKKLLNNLVSIFLVAWLGSYTYEAFRIYDKTESTISTFKDVFIIFDNFIFKLALDSPKNIFIILIPSLFVLYIVYISLDLLKIKMKREGNFSFSLSKLRTLTTIILGSFYLFVTFKIMDFRIHFIDKVDINIEIIRPYISEKEYFVLKSDQLQVEDKEAFNLVNSKIKEIASDNNLKIK